MDASLARIGALGGFLASRSTVEQVTAALGCTDDQAVRVLVCREPRWWRSRRDMATIARLADVDAGALARLLRR